MCRETRKSLNLIFRYVGALFLFSIANFSFAADEPIATLRDAPLGDNSKAPLMTQHLNKDIREIRNYPEQPPLIPHKIEGYQVDVRVNKCLTCHSRKGVGESQAPMISITHFMDRQGQFLATVSPRRYFCNQCHVPQHDIKPLVGNEFVDVDSLLNK